MSYQLEFSTHLTILKKSGRGSVDGISREMTPYLHMSLPRGITNLSSIPFQSGQRMFRSWILLFRIIPIDYSDVTLLSLEEDVSFVEQSHNTKRSWRHARNTTPAGDGCVLTDQLTFKPRAAGWLVCKVVRVFFRHWHRMLQRCNGVLMDRLEVAQS